MISCTIDKFKILEEILEQNHIKLLSKKIYYKQVFLDKWECT